MAITETGRPGPVRDEALTALAADLHGPLLRPHDDGYDPARRVWNGNVDRRPAAIARCLDAADVQRAVVFARDEGLLLSVRGGGHSAPGYGTNDGGLVIDLSLLKAVTVDADARTAQVGGGVLWRELDEATQRVGLATTGGTVSNTGVAGLTLGGGLGWLMGKHGLAVDNLLSAEVVTADGELHTVDAEREPDLFWALRGGGGNFGVVPSLRYRLHPVTEVLGGMVVHPLERAAEVLRFYRDFCPTLPDEAEAYCALLTDPQAGVPVIALLLGYNGPLDEGERVLRPAREFGPPLADLVAPMPYVARQSMLDEPNAVHGLHRYWRSAFTEQLDDGLIDAVTAAAAGSTSPLSAVIFFYVHGAATRVAPEDTAFAARRAQWDVDVIAQWTEAGESERHTDWLRSSWAAAEPHMDGSAYVNHLATDDAPEKVRASFGTNLDRLRLLKARHDPTNLFRLNPNIAPLTPQPRRSAD
ncbi:FAD/FMN-containing dehydrogenase [Geodermatophilus dictyosporus]|uniref:FAD/FMN-containing dehydrogenase n=1 Tax=Geodermatophilus dictyosporus TaxID=1523247 RepID=A0A1I5RVD3_9ACTN|nr:FAD-binding oxidoreductase [Geodermatophilus dictyosporus]SFP62393.1 FAD/FMN-containing dehydrogenase [Geodermatophilus dictyosporus]